MLFGDSPSDWLLYSFDLSSPLSFESTVRDEVGLGLVGTEESCTWEILRTVTLDVTQSFISFTCNNLTPLGSYLLVLFGHVKNMPAAGNGYNEMHKNQWPAKVTVHVLLCKETFMSATLFLF